MNKKKTCIFVKHHVWLNIIEARLMLIYDLLLLNVWPCCFTPCWLQNVRPDWERRKRERCFQSYMYRIIVWHCKTAGRWQNRSGRGGNGSKIERGQQATCHYHDSDDQVNKMCLHQRQNGDHCCARKLASGPPLLFVRLSVIGCDGMWSQRARGKGQFCILE